MSQDFKQSGVVLIAVLIFMQILAMLGLFALEMAHLENKMVVDFQEGYEIEQAAHLFFQSLERSLIKDDFHCRIPVQNSQYFVNKSEDEWQEMRACSAVAGDVKFFYMIEDLEDDVCALLFDDKNKSAHYLRVTLFVVSNLNDKKRLLQGTLIKPSLMVRSCNSVSHFVQAGWQQRRFSLI